MAAVEDPVEYLTTIKIGKKGQLSVPKQFRKELRLQTSAPFAVLPLGNGLLLLPQQQRFERLCEQISSTLARAGLTQESILDTLAETRNRVFRRKYVHL